MSDKITTAKMQEGSQQNCPLMKLSTELRLEICKYAFQHDVEAIHTAPESYDSSQPPYSSVLALLYTSRTLRAECIDAVDPLALACLNALNAQTIAAQGAMIAKLQASGLGLWAPLPPGFRKTASDAMEAIDRLRASSHKAFEVFMLVSDAKKIDIMMGEEWVTDSGLRWGVGAREAMGGE